jgi:hypothetical protein
MNFSEFPFSTHSGALGSLVPNQAAHHTHHHLHYLIVYESLLPRKRVPRLELQPHPQGPI